MSYSGYNSASYPPQGQPGYPSYPPAPGIAQGGPYPPQGSPPPPGGGYPQRGGYHDPNQPPYGELLLAVFVKPPQYSHGSDQGGYQQPGYSSPSPSYAGGPGGYIPTYTPTYNAGPPGYAPQGSPALGHKGPSPAPSQEYAGTPPGIPVYGAPPAYGAPSAGYPGQYLPAQPGYGAPGPQSGYGHAPSAAPAPISTTPVRFQFAQKKGFDRSGKIIDENKNVVYVLKDEADEHSWTKYLKSRPLMISRADGTKVCSFHWKDGPNEAEAKVFAVWAQKGEKKKMKVSGDILDQDLKFKLPNGRTYEWEGPGDVGVFNLLDHQQVSGEGFDRTPKSVARYTMHTEQRDATLDILPEALAVPHLLDAAVITTFQLEYVVWDMNEQANNAA